jgi:biopolymer transport protein ExbB
MRQSRLVAVATFAVAVLLATVATAAPAHAESKGLMQAFIEDGGAIGWVIIILSIATVAMIIEFAVNIRRDKICPPELIDEIEALLEENELQEALELCESEPNFVTNCLAAGLPVVNEGYDKVKSAVDVTAGIEALKLQQKVGWMLFFSNLGPLLGLFGTVVGMIQAFNVIVELGVKVTPKDLAIGISAALVTTMQGLIVGIPALYAYQYFRNKGIRIAVDFAGILDDMIARFKGR